MRGKRLPPLHWRIFGAWVLIGAGLATFAGASGLANEDTMVGFVIPASVAILVVVALVIRFAAKRDKTRTIIAAVGPVIMVALIALLAFVALLGAFTSRP